jgi:hypothetical protein
MDVVAGQTVTVLRDPAKDETGDPVGPPAGHTIGNCVFWWNQVSENSDRRETATATGNLAVPRGSDITFTDRVRLEDNSIWSVIGPSQWDQVNPLDGYDFGYKIVEVRAVT